MTWRWNRQRRVLWLEQGHRAVTEFLNDSSGLPSEESLAMMLSAIPTGPTRWIVDDLWTPALILGDFLEVPRGVEAQDGFMRWRYTQQLGLEEPQFVQSLLVGDASWLLLGMPQSLRDLWLQMALKLGRPIHSLLPRWLWVFNRLAPSLNRPGMLLSLSEVEEGSFTGSLLAWGQSLTLIRQWREPAPSNCWFEERILPTAAYLHREGRTPQDLLVWGAREWSGGSIPAQLLPRDIPQFEAV